VTAADEAGAFQVFRGGGRGGNGRRGIRLLLLIIGRHPGDFSQPLTSPKVALTCRFSVFHTRIISGVARKSGKHNNCEAADTRE